MNSRTKSDLLAALGADKGAQVISEIESKEEETRAKRLAERRRKRQERYLKRFKQFLADPDFDALKEEHSGYDVPAYAALGRAVVAASDRITLSEPANE